MKKQLLCLGMVLISMLANAQYDFSLTGYNEAPVKGMVWGVTGGGFTSMLTNRDDIEADSRLDPQMMNFSYAAGVEFIYWFQNSIGFGAQALYWKGGAAYKGSDSAKTWTLTGKADLTYVKVPFLFHYKSFNRYYPSRRIRFNAMFGPYVALLNGYSDEVKYKDANGNVFDGRVISGQNYETQVGQVKAKLNGSVYNPVDLGFVVALGGEVRLWKRTVLSLMLRTDIGISNVENNKSLKITYETDNTKEYDFAPWKGYYAKYVLPDANDVAKGYVANRPPTKNFSAGAFLSLRKYLAY